MRTNQLLCAAAALLSLALAQPAAAQKKYGPGVTDSEIKIGQTMPYSGPASAYGTIGKAENAYFNMINDKGGINGRKIVFLSLDDGYSPPQARWSRRASWSSRRMCCSTSIRWARRPIRRSRNISTRRRCRSSSSPPARPNGAIPSTSPGRWASSPPTRPRATFSRGTSSTRCPTRGSACSIRTMITARTISRA